MAKDKEKHKVGWPKGKPRGKKTKPEVKVPSPVPTQPVFVKPVTSDEAMMALRQLLKPHRVLFTTKPSDDPCCPFHIFLLLNGVKEGIGVYRPDDITDETVAEIRSMMDELSRNPTVQETSEPAEKKSPVAPTFKVPDDPQADAAFWSNYLRAQPKVTIVTAEDRTGPNAVIFQGVRYEIPAGVPTDVPACVVDIIAESDKALKIAGRRQSEVLPMGGSPYVLPQLGRLY